jgi:hypothetical protein
LSMIKGMTETGKRAARAWDIPRWLVAMGADPVQRAAPMVEYITTHGRAPGIRSPRGITPLTAPAYGYTPGIIDEVYRCTTPPS